MNNEANAPYDNAYAEAHKAYGEAVKAVKANAAYAEAHKAYREAVKAVKANADNAYAEAHKAYREAEAYIKAEEAKAKEAQAQTQEPVVCPDCKAEVLYECVACSSNNYPAQPVQRKWVGLTDNEIRSIGRSLPNQPNFGREWLEFAWAVIAKLKEKNT